MVASEGPNNWVTSSTYEIHTYVSLYPSTYVDPIIPNLLRACAQFHECYFARTPTVSLHYAFLDLDMIYPLERHSSELAGLKRGTNKKKRLMQGPSSLSYLMELPYIV